MRKHNKVMMLVVAIVVIIAFTFLYNPNSREGGGKITVLGRDYSKYDIEAVQNQNHLAQQLMQLAYSRMQEAGRGPDSQRIMQQIQEDPLMDYTQVATARRTVSMDPTRQDDGITDLLENQAILEDETQKLGLKPTDDDVADYINNTCTAFRKNGQFSRAEYDAFIENPALGGEAAAKKRLYTLVKNILIVQRMKELANVNISPSELEADLNYESYRCISTAKAIEFKKQDYENQPVTDEEAKAFYDGEEKKVRVDNMRLSAIEPSLLSAPKRGLAYVFIAEPKPPVPPVPEDLSKLPDDQKKAKEEEFQKKNADYATQVAAAGTEKKTLGEKALALSKKVQADKGQTPFADLAKADGFEAKTIPSFERESAPEEIRSETELLNALFKTGKEGDLRKYGFIRSEGKGWYVYSRTEATEPELLTFELAKPKIIELLKKQKSQSRHQEAATAARNAIQKALDEGKSFQDAAASAGVSATELVINPSKPDNRDAPLYGPVSQEVRNLGPNQLSPKPTPSQDGGLVLVYVERQELPNDPKMQQDKEMQRTQRLAREDDGPFNFWLNQAKRKAAINMKSSPR